jgi:hypothetical protein
LPIRRVFAGEFPERRGQGVAGDEHDPGGVLGQGSAISRYRGWPSKSGMRRSVSITS